MATVFEVTAADWPRFRFAHSPLWETVQAVMTLRSPRVRQHHLRWAETIDVAALLPRIPALAALTPSPGPVWVPDFLVPAPTGASGAATAPGIEEELAAVRAYPPPAVRADLMRSLRSRSTRQRRAVLQPLIENPPLAVGQLTDELRIAWRVLVEPFWPAIRKLVEDDIAFRSRAMARRGYGAMLADLHEDIRFAPDRITVHGNDAAVVELGGRGLLLMPSAFCWPLVLTVIDPPWPPSLAYPARGVGNLWATPEPALGALAAILGESRAQLLQDLAEPRSTTALALRHGLSPATTSVHVHRLRDAGLLSATRLGREVRYRRTELGTALITGAEGSLR
ncbi:DUF5937 family protein [Jatrophihabitans telluris]|uniref:DUF5937 family protein n=1 Tax=Jatrophihabitans telluris TaxID=2038343 RepID=A0ABY4QYL3_9ACTN|nr:DUF5937 family protein [Jatrophihabitans telluris]UQX88625.1 DUF5937 family protein [Jatrophihabitans telluris]